MSVLSRQGYIHENGTCGLNNEIIWNVKAGAEAPALLSFVVFVVVKNDNRELSERGNQLFPVFFSKMM